MADARAGDDLDQLIRRVDPDRWLCTRFIGDVAARADVLALYAYDYELGRAQKVASNSLVAEMRLAWWNEALDEIFDGRPMRRHPVAEGLARAVRRRALPRQPLEAMIDGHIELLGQTPVDEAAAERWASLAQGTAAELAAKVLDPDRPSAPAASAGKAWGLALLMRSASHDRASLSEPLRQALSETRSNARALSVQAFPAALPARLARFDLAGVSPPAWRKQLSLVFSAATGLL